LTIQKSFDQAKFSGCSNSQQQLQAVVFILLQVVIYLLGYRFIIIVS